MANVIAVVNQKGGVGKTTTAINLGAYLALQGKYVLLIDMDPQCNATSGLGFDVHTIEQGVYEVLVGEKKMSEVILKTTTQGFSLLPATLDLAGAGVDLVGYENREFRLQEALLEVRNQFDYVIIDCPPSLGLVTVNCLIAANQVLIPVQAEYYALEGLGQLLNTIHLIKDNIKDDLEVLGAVLTMYDKRNLLAWQVKRELLNHFPYKVFNSIIPRNIRLTEAPSHGLPINDYSPSSRGARAYEKLAREVLEIF